jgi:O-antigen ligase
MTPAAAERLRALLRDSPERRQLGVTVALVAILAAAALYLYVTIKFVPDMGIRLMFGGLVLALLVVLGPRFTLPMYFATFFGTAIHLPGLPVSLNRLCAAAFVLSWLAALYRRRFVVPPSASGVLLTLFTVYAVVGSFVLRVPGTAGSYNQLVYLLVCFAAASTFRTREDLLGLLKAIVTITCVLSVVGLLEYILRRDLFPQFSDNRLWLHDFRINGISRNAIQYAFNLAWALPWALFLHIEAKGGATRRLALIAIAYMVVLCLLTRNRQSPVIIGAMLLWGGLLIRYQYRARLLAVMALCGLLVAPFIAMKLAERFFSPHAPAGRDMSLTIRRDKLLAAQRMIVEHPWTGIGLNTFKDKWWDYRARGRTYVIHAEKGNQHFVDLGYVQILVETGIVGVVLFAGIVIATLLLWWRTLQRARRLEDTFAYNGLVAASMGFVQLGLSMFLQDTFFFPQTYLLFGLLFALVTITGYECARVSNAPTDVPR